MRTAASTSSPRHWNPAALRLRLDAKIAVRIEGRAVWVGAWLFVLESDLGGRAPVILLDTDLDENRPEDREITHYLYGGDEAYRLKQEMVLGIGGVRLLHALGFDISAVPHERRPLGAARLELLRRHAYPPERRAARASRPTTSRACGALCRFTTHTPVEAGHDQFSYDLVQRLLRRPRRASRRFAVWPATTISTRPGSRST